MVRRGTEKVFEEIEDVIEKRKGEPFFPTSKARKFKKPKKVLKKIAKKTKGHAKTMVVRRPPEKLFARTAPTFAAPDYSVFSAIRQIRPPSYPVPAIPLEHERVNELYEKYNKNETKQMIENKIISDITKQQMPSKKENYELYSISSQLPVAKPAVEPTKPQMLLTKREIASQIVAKDIMSTSPISVSINDPLDRALEMILRYNIRGVPVTSGDSVVGVIEEVDIIALFSQKLPEGALKQNRETVLKLVSTPINQIDLRKPLIVSPEASMEQIMLLMNQNKANRVCIVEDGKFVGVVTKDDVVRALIRSTSSLEVPESQIMSTGIDRLLKIVESEGKISLEKSALMLKAPIQVVESWAKLLEEHNLIDTEYPIVGSPMLIKK